MDNKYEERKYRRFSSTDIGIVVNARGRVGRFQSNHHIVEA